MSSLLAHALYISHPREAQLQLHQQLDLLQASAALLFAGLAVLQLLAECCQYLSDVLSPTERVTLHAKSVIVSALCRTVFPHHMPVISMIWVSSAQEVKFGVIFLICQDSSLELGACTTITSDQCRRFRRQLILEHATAVSHHSLLRTVLFCRQSL